MTELDDSIDELAAQIECAIQSAKETNEKFDGCFDPKYRAMNADAAALFS